MVITALLAPVLSIAAPLAEAPAEFYQPEFSAEVRALIVPGDAAATEDKRAALEALADAGDVSALEVLGELHMLGLGSIGKDVARGCDYFEQVGDRRADSLHNLASCYWNGDGRVQDYPKARALYLKAAEAGWRMSFCAYGKMLVLGQGGAADPAEGIRLCRLTALLGDKDALTDYGTFLLTGKGVERDPVTARYMLERAAEQNQANAAFLLGQIHSKGDGTPKDLNRAGEWFVKAHEGGRRDAAERAADAYFIGGYTPLEGDQLSLKPSLLRKAIVWYEKALAYEVPGSERHTRIVALIPKLTALIEKAENPAED
jgi:TPR repeat protein